MPDSEKTGAKAGENKAIKELKKNADFASAWVLTTK